MRARWSKDRSAPKNGGRLWIDGCECYVEVRPKLGVYDVLRPMRYGHRCFDTLVCRTPDLFAAISSAIHGRPSC